VEAVQSLCFLSLDRLLPPHPLLPVLQLLYEDEEANTAIISHHERPRWSGASTLYPYVSAAQANAT
jgi:hypothetical protein